MLLAISASLRFVSDRLVDGAFHLEFGESASLDGAAQANGELAIIAGGVSRLPPMGGDQFANGLKHLLLDGLRANA